MTEQEKREKVIKGLECCVKFMGECESCSYDEGRGNCGCAKKLYEDALALLKAQEPMVMTVDEVRMWVSVPRIDREPIWVETENSVNAWIVSDEYWDMPIDVNLSSDLYGKTWRCWTSRPDEKRRAETPWE